MPIRMKNLKKNDGDADLGGWDQGRDDEDRKWICKALKNRVIGPSASNGSE